MQLTPNYNLKKPEGTDPVDIQDFNDNADILDAELNKKADSAGGDISNMTIKALEEPAGTQFPIPEAGETSKSFLGKIRKFMNDFKSWNTGVCMIGQIVNNCVTNNDKLPLSAAQGKVLMDLYSVLNTNLGGYKLYLTLSSMGVSDGCSILDIINALPAKSLFLYHEQYNGATIKDMPPNYHNGGIIRILNIGGRYEIDYRRQNANSLLSPPEHYIGSVAASNPTSIEWSKNLTSADIIMKTVSLTQVTVSANSGTTGSTTNISAQIPAGYKLLDAREAGSGNNGCYVYFFNVDGANITLQLRNVTNAAITTTPLARLLLISK